MSLADDLNRDLEREQPALYRALSPLGRRAAFPPDIPVQAAEAEGTTYNGTIGLFTDGRGHAVPLPSMAASLELSPEDRDRAFLYSPVAGLPELRERWRAWQRQGVGEELPSSLPLVTCGLTHALSLAADLFGGSGRKVVVAAPFWGNYRQIFALRTGAEVVAAAGYRDGRFDPGALAGAVATVPTGEPAVVLLNFPSNPGGYAPTVDERRELVGSLLRAAEERPLVTLCDDAYTGLVYEEGVPAGSLFWELAGRHPQLVPVKVDGATKELFFFGGRVGFLTFAVDPASAAARVLESKARCLIRAAVGSPPAVSQVLLLQALRSGRARAEVAQIQAVARARYQAVRPALAALDRRLLRPLPANAGFFVLLELPEELGLGSDEVRRHLIEHHATGVVSLPPRYLRLALCSVAAGALPEMVSRLERGVKELAERRAASRR